MKFIKFPLKLFVIGILLFVFFHLAAYLYARLSPKVDIKSVNNVYLYDNHGDLFFQGSGQNEWIPLEKMSPYIINATISIEDKNFYKHFGFDYLRIVKSFYNNVRAGKIVEGASTITQQYARNLYLDFDKNWRRKLEESWLAFEIEMHYSKDEILEGYLNTINYGNGVLGIENAANYYFNKSASELTLSEASMLAGIPKSPNNYSPLNDELLAKKRQNLILYSMVKNNYITEEEKTEAFNNELVYVGKKEKLNLSTLMYYQNAVMKELRTIDSIPTSLLKTNGLKIYTALDIDAQTFLEESIYKNLKENESIQVAAVMATPSCGSIIALVGGRDYLKSQFNRATDSKRQVGSTMKPFLYYAALENGFTAATTFLSEPTTFTFSNNKTYAPRNFADVYPEKPISMAAALSYSDNIYAIKTHLFLGEETLVDIIERVGIKQKVSPLPSLPLGTEEINIIDFLTGYSTLANLGDKVNLHLIKKIEDIKGNVLYEHKENKINVLNRNIAFIINDLLTTSYDYTMVDYTYPSALNIAPKLSKKYAIKTGSTEFDTWIIGYNKDIILGVWNGYDKNQPLAAGEVRYSRHIWADAIEVYLKDKEGGWYDIPANVVGVLIDPISGQLATQDTKKKKIFYFVKGTEPLYRKETQ
jgi:penicillin-binding protein 2D